ncbi:hypothetical protein E2C01_036740 [Portunus trituberculatus]|uniref:Uncharacterized protein n=1 Tax=Portunus trituberculatus TaxID=210409 RepID=A0A5B7FD98_PORTR|nr:hypothetical protein [Portunus trituberculatus]
MGWISFHSRLKEFSFNLVNAQHQSLSSTARWWVARSVDGSGSQYTHLAQLTWLAAVLPVKRNTLA